MHPGTRHVRPTRRNDLRSFAVAKELVLVSADSLHTFALNESAAAIWQLCDGLHTVADILHQLRSRFSGDDVVVLADLADALLRLRSVGLLESDVAGTSGRRQVLRRLWR